MFGINKFDDRIKAVEKKYLDQEIEIEKLKTHINSLRGLINRKRSLALDHETETENIKSIDGLDELRFK